MTLDMGAHLRESNDDLFYTRSMRRQLVKAITKDGTEFPTHSEKISALAGVLSDIDRQALSLQKLKTDQAAVDNQAAAAALIATVIAQGNVKNIGRATDEVARTQPVLEDIIAVSLNPGEMDIGTNSLDYDQFMEQARQIQKK